MMSLLDYYYPHHEEDWDIYGRDWEQGRRGHVPIPYPSLPTCDYSTPMPFIYTLPYLQFWMQ